VLAEGPQIAGLGARSPGRVLESGVEIEVLDRSFFSRVSRLRSRSRISSSPKPERVRSTFGLACRSASRRARSCVVPGAGDLVEGEVEQTRLLYR
jgi:hypothetical protein